METFECQYCKSVFKNNNNLKTHQKRTKYCLSLQKIENPDIISDLKECEHCLKFFSSNQLGRHLDTCKIKKNNYVKGLEDKVKDLEDKLKEKDSQITSLQFKLEIYKKDHDTIHEIYKDNYETIKEIAKQPKNTTNRITFSSSMDFDVGKIKEIVETKYIEDYIFSGQKGIAKFAVENVLKDETGNLKYICTDPSRQIFKYKDTAGNIMKDVEAKKLTNFLVDGGIKDKACDMSIKWWTDEDGKINGSKCGLLLEQSESLREFDDDNTIFKKELVSLTTI